MHFRAAKRRPIHRLEAVQRNVFILPHPTLALLAPLRRGRQGADDIAQRADKVFAKESEQAIEQWPSVAGRRKEGGLGAECLVDRGQSGDQAIVYEVVRMPAARRAVLQLGD